MTIDDLPRHRGMPVPYVALWTQEAPTLDLYERLVPAIEKNPITGRLGLIFLGNRSAEERDENGVLWTPELSAYGQGEALLSQLHGQRQRHSLLGGHCQVCNVTMDPVTFLLPKSWQGRATVNTSTAPVCRECIPKALLYCPHLRHEGPWAVATAKAKHSGYVGELLHVNERDGSHWNEKNVTLSIGDPRLALFLAKQAVATLTEMTWEDTP